MAERNRIALIQEVRVVHDWKARPSLCPVCALLSIACSLTLVIPRSRSRFFVSRGGYIACTPIALDALPQP
jgi:hypothetical protein